MASSNDRRLCINCNKAGGIMSCGGCEKWFCRKHIDEHRQQIAIEMDQIGQQYDVFHRDLMQDYGTHPLIKRIDFWEQESIKAIQEAAEKARSDLQNYFVGVTQRLKTSLIEILREIQSSRESDDYTEIDLDKWLKKLEELRKIFNQPSTIDIVNDEKTIPNIRVVQRTNTSDTSLMRDVKLNRDFKWLQNGITVAGGNEAGSGMNQLNNPYNLFVNDDDETLYIADYENHRIVEWKSGATIGKVVAGGNGCGDGNHQLKNPVSVILDKVNDSFIITDYGNRRVVRWSRQNGRSGETIISNVGCWGLTMDDDRFLYVVDVNKHEVRRYRNGETYGIVVAGGNGAGNRLNQLHFPRHVFVDRDRSVYVSDQDNNRIMKWTAGSKEGIVLIDDQKNVLSDPNVVILDQFGSIYVGAPNHHQIVRWFQGDAQANIIVGGHGSGSKPNQLSTPRGMAFDRLGNLYVCDSVNHRVQKFSIHQSE